MTTNQDDGKRLNLVLPSGRLVVLGLGHVLQLLEVDGAPAGATAFDDMGAADRFAITIAARQQVMRELHLELRLSNAPLPN